MLELDDIQHFLLTRPPASRPTTRSSRFPEALAGPQLACRPSRQSWQRRVGRPVADRPWVTIAFTSNGLRALGIDDESLLTFPQEFPTRNACRAEDRRHRREPSRSLENGPARRRPSRHRHPVRCDVPERKRRVERIRTICVRITGVELIPTLDLKATPPFDFGRPRPFLATATDCRSRRFSTCDMPMPGLGCRVEAGRVFPRGIPTKKVWSHPLPKPGDSCPVMGAFSLPMARRSTSARFREFLAKRVRLAMSRSFRPEAMAVAKRRAARRLRRKKTTPRWAPTRSATTISITRRGIPHGYAVPLGLDAGRMNPRHTAVNMNRRRMI